jgi:hypothetical protein
MSEAYRVVRLIKDAPNGHVPLDQLKQKYHDKYGKDLILERVVNLPGVYIDSYPVKDSVHIGANQPSPSVQQRATSTSTQASTPPLTLTSLGTTRSRSGSSNINHTGCLKIQRAKEQQERIVSPVTEAEGRTHDRAPFPNHHDAIIKTLKSQDGRIAFNKFRKEYKLVTNNIPPYPKMGVRKWILSTEGVEIKKGVVQLSSTTTDPKFEESQVQEGHDKKVPKRNKKRKKKGTKAKANSPPENLSTAQKPEQKKKRLRAKAKVNKPPCNLPIRNDCYYGMANHKADNRKCIMHFGCTSSGKTLWPGGATKRLCGVSKGVLLSRAIVSGYVSNKIKKAGAHKAARKTRNLARLQKKYNPTPAHMSPHALQRYKERGSASSPIYKPIGNRNEVIVVTYVPIRREHYLDAKASRRTFRLEVDRMSQLSKKSDLPKNKLSSRDEYLFKLSSQAVKKEEYRRRSNQKKKAYEKQCSYPLYENWTPPSRNTTAPPALHIRSKKERKGHKPAGLKKEAKGKKKWGSSQLK